jgi:site-specific recombinase XerD
LTAIAGALTIASMQLELWHAPEMNTQLARDAGAGPASPASSLSRRDTESIERAGESPLDALALEYLKAARAERTRTAYANDWRLFERWCAEHHEQTLPASTPTLVRYLTHLAQSGRKASTIRRARIAIGMLHGQRGLPRPDLDDRVRTLERGIGRVHGTREVGAAPLRVPELERIVGTLGAGARDDRDRALMLLGFAGAFRSSELVAFDVADLEPTADGMRVLVRRSKEDPTGRGTITEVLRARNEEMCPVGALTRWLARLSEPGPLFRRMHGDIVSGERLRPRAVSRIVQRTAARAGLATEYSSHSLRAGLATSAHARGSSARDIQVHGRWKDLRSLYRYVHVSGEATRRVVGELL